MTTICGAVIARDEEKTIERCLRALAWVDERLVIVDDRSTDRTQQLAEALGTTTRVRHFLDYGSQRNAALEAATSEWVLFVDADEVVTPELASAARSVVSGCGPEVAGYWIPRRNIILGRWMRGAGWSPDYQLRLLRRSAARYGTDRTVHEVVDLSGASGHLKQPLIHFNYDTLGQFLAKQRVYSAMEAADMRARGLRPRPHNYLLQPWRQFWRRYARLEGYRDGPLGLLLSLLLAWYELRAYLHLRALWAGERGRAE